MINCAGQSNQRIQKVVERDSTGRILKTFDGYVYRLYDSQGRLIELWGNRKTPDMDDNFRTIADISDSVVIHREYFFDIKNTKCKIIDSLDCYISKGYFINGKLVKIEYWNPVKGSNGKVINHKLVETEDNPRRGTFISFLPDYLRKNN